MQEEPAQLNIDISSKQESKKDLVTLIVKGARLTEQTLEQAVKKFLEEVRKSK